MKAAFLSGGLPALPNSHSHSHALLRAPAMQTASVYPRLL
jgi:hypothetical protein